MNSVDHHAGLCARPPSRLLCSPAGVATNPTRPMELLPPPTLARYHLKPTWDHVPAVRVRVRVVTLSLVY